MSTVAQPGSNEANLPSASLALIPDLAQQLRVFKTLSSIIDYAYTFDLGGRFLYSNQALLDLLGLRLDEVIGKTFLELPYPIDLAVKLQAQIEQVFATKQKVIDETSYISPAGVVGYYEYIFNPVFEATERLRWSRALRGKYLIGSVTKKSKANWLRL
jgi:PAS domain S-box-containing protein